MKKLIAITMILTITITAAACESKATSSDKTEVPKPAQIETQTQNKPDEKQIVGPMKLAYEGKIDNLQIGVGDKLQNVISVLGEPSELNHFEGSSYISYQDVSFMLDRIVETTKDEATILGIVVSEGYELYEVKVGMKSDEIKNVLGAAAQEYQEGEEEGDAWKLEYNCGDYLLTFFFNDKDSPSTSAYLSKLSVEK